jgi:hypothetical protein
MDLQLRFTDKDITSWGAMALIKRMLDHLDFQSVLSRCGLPAPGSNRAYPSEQLITQFMLSIWCGANRFEHCEVTRFDAALARIFGIERMANFKAITRLFSKFDQARNQHCFAVLYRWLFEQVGASNITLDLDSSVITRYGQPQGASKGYNARKPGRLSHHPLMAFVADSRMLANCWLRPGSSHTANNTRAFLANTQEHLAGKRIGLLRADSGFCDDAFLTHLQQSAIPYVIALRLNQPLQRALVHEAEHGQWWSLEEGIELCEINYHAPSWSAPRRIIGIRQHVQQRVSAKGKTLSLFADAPDVSCWRYAALVTDLLLPAQQVWRTYRGRADCENRIKELKYDFAMDKLALKDFWATEAAMQMVMLAFNLMSLFRQALLTQINRSGANHEPKQIQHTLKTLRYKLFAQAGYVTHEGRQPILRLATAMRNRQWMGGLWEAAKTFELPQPFRQHFSF